MMKATIDTEKKEITFHDNYSLKEIITFLEKLFTEDYLEWTINHELVSWYTYPTYPIYTSPGIYTDDNETWHSSPTLSEPTSPTNS